MKKGIVMLLMAGMLVLGGCGAQDAVEPTVSTQESEIQESTEESSVEERNEAVEEVGNVEHTSDSVDNELEGHGYGVCECMGKWVESIVGNKDHTGTVIFGLNIPEGCIWGSYQYDSDSVPYGGFIDSDSGSIAYLVVDQRRVSEEVQELDDVFTEKFLTTKFFGVLDAVVLDNDEVKFNYEIVDKELKNIAEYLVQSYYGDLSFRDDVNNLCEYSFNVYILESKEVPGAYLCLYFIFDEYQIDTQSKVEHMLGTMTERIYELNGKYY